MIAKFYEIFIVESSLLQTITNLIFLCVLVASILCLLKSFASSKSVSRTSLTDILFVDFFTAFCFMYNNIENILDKALHEKYQMALMGLTVFFGIITILRHLFKKPIENGTLLVTDGQGNKQITGEEYTKEFNRRKTKNTILVAIREIIKIVSLAYIPVYEKLLAKELAAIKVIKFDEAIIAGISYYSIIIIVGIIFILIIDWILDKIF